MIDGGNSTTAADDILNLGEMIIDKNEKQKGYPSLQGLEAQYSQVRVSFEPNFERRLVNLATIIGFGQVENSYDFTTNSQSFLPQLSFTNEEETGANNPSNIIPGGLNLSNISFNEPSSPIAILPINDKNQANVSSMITPSPLITPAQITLKEEVKEQKP